MARALIRASLALAIVATALPGCGTAGPAGTPRARMRGTPAPTTAPGAPGGPGAAPAIPAGDATALLAAFRARLASARALATEVTVASRGPYYGGERTATERSSRSRSRMVWAQPARLRAEIHESTTPTLAGATVVWQGGDKVRVKGAGALGLVPLSLAHTDARLLTNRNHAFVRNHPMAHLQRLAGPAGSWRPATPRAEAPEATWVEVIGVERPDAGVTRELLALSQDGLTPAAIVMLEGERAVVSFRFSRFSWDPALDATTFRP